MSSVLAQFEFERAPVIIWRKTSRLVEIGKRRITATMSRWRNGCDDIEAIEQNRTSIAERNLFHQLYRYCQETYHETYLPTFSNLLLVSNPEYHYRLPEKRIQKDPFANQSHTL